MEKNRADELEYIASEVRKDIVRMVGVARSGPLETPFVISSLLVYLYWEELLVVADNPGRSDRDRFMLGMSCGIPALYSVLARRGYFEREDLWHYRRLGAMLQSIPDYKRTPGIDAPLAENGNELAVASALNESLKKDGFDSRVFCLLDEEIFYDPDFIMEAKRAADEKLDHLVLLIAMPLIPQSGHCREFYEHQNSLSEIGWTISVTDGNCFYDMEKIFRDMDINNGSPKAVFVNMKDGTEMPLVRSRISGKSMTLSLDDIDQALEELEGKTNE